MRALFVAMVLVATSALGACGGGGPAPAVKAAARGFPVLVENAFGPVTIEAPPERVVSLGFRDQDFLIALGVMPVATREYFGRQPGALWPWARGRVQGKTPTVLPGEEIDYEKVAALRPDLISAVYASLTEAEYDRLSQIAPVIAQPPGGPGYAVSWQYQTLVTGRALGREDEAKRIVADTERLIARARRASPDLEGETGVYAYSSPEGLGAYPSDDVRGRFLRDLGLRTPPAIDRLAGGEYFAAISGERLDLLDAGVLVVAAIGDDPATSRAEVARAQPLFGRIPGVRAGRDVYPDRLTGAAVAFSSPLSLPVALKGLAPQLERAAARDTTTPRR